MIEKEEDLKCANNHQLPIIMVILDQNLELKQRFLCQDCIRSLSRQFQAMGYELLMQQVKKNHKQQTEALESAIQLNIKQIEDLIKNIEKLKSAIEFQLGEIILCGTSWIKKLFSVEQECSKSLFQKELEHFISKQLVSQNLFIHEINKENSFWTIQINKKLEDLSSFKDQSCKEILNSLAKTNPIIKVEDLWPLQISQQNILQSSFLKTTDQQIVPNKIAQDGWVKLQLIDDSVKQRSICYAVAFNKSGTRMVSTSNFDINVWNVIDGKLSLLTQLTGHNDEIYCIIYSKQSENFISSCKDKTIICWKQIEQNEWKRSKYYTEHKGWIGTMILSNDENQLYSAGEDQQIIIWKVDFNQNELTYLYSLEKHSKSIRAISLNECETILVSCGDDKQIMVWEKHEGMFQIKQVFTPVLNCAGCHIKFLKGNKFIWVTNSKVQNFLCQFELKDDLFYEDVDYRINLDNSSKNLGCGLFPIVYLKEINVIIVRSKKSIYVMREINGRLIIQSELDTCTKWNFGTITDNGKYLVFWDNLKGGYTTYELI